MLRACYYFNADDRRLRARRVHGMGSVAGRRAASRSTWV